MIADGLSYTNLPFSAIILAMETILTRTNTLVREAALQAYEKMMDIFPEALLAILIVLAGWIVASIFYRLCVQLLAFFAIDKLVAKTPLDKMLKGIGIHKSASGILGLLVFWLTILVTLIFASEILSLEKVSNALEVVTRYIPQVIAAFLIVVFGMLLAKFLQTIVVQSISKTGLGYERSVGRAVQMIVLVFVFLAAVEQLGLNLSFITTNVLIFFAAILLICGLAIVLSARTVLENALLCQHLKRNIEVGSEISVGDVNGKVKSFTLAGVVVETSKGATVVPASLFFTQTYTIKKDDD
ncbi:MAG: hypothetical protein CMN79_04440 [Spirochaetales bacterium]|jgi:hypothetical protein|nr:hypothetical protein [Spirochaetales bacterium]